MRIGYRQLLSEYFTLGWVSIVGAAISLYNAYNSSQSSGGSPGSQGGATYVPQGQPAADQNWQDIMKQLMGASGGQADMLLPFLKQAFGESSDIYKQLAGTMGKYGGYLENQGTKLFGAADNLHGVGDAVWRTAADPEHKLHDSMLQKTQEQSRAASSMRGIGTSAQSAGLENEAVGNFDMNWEDRQLGRQLEGAKGMAGTYDAAGRSTLAGMSELSGAAGMYKGAGALPFELSDMFSHSMAGGVYNPMRDILANLQSYMGLGQSGSNQAFGQGQTNLNNQTSALNTAANSPMWGQLANYFGGTGGGGSSGSGGSSWVDSSGWGGA